MHLPAMKTRSLLLSLSAMVAGLGAWVAGEEKTEAVTGPEAVVKESAELLEARLRSQLLHETIHGSLQVMHRDFFREGDRLRIPSSSMEDVFKELERSWNVRVSWMAVNAKAMNIDHLPDGPFEVSAASAIGKGEEMIEEVSGGRYRYAGAISLANECLKCHVPDRQNLETRKAAVLISMPLKREEIRGK
jgi:hypothetical protein